MDEMPLAVQREALDRELDEVPERGTPVGIASGRLGESPFRNGLATRPGGLATGWVASR